MANQQIYTTIPWASKHCLPRRGKLRADMKSPSQVALVALLPGERKRRRQRRDTARQAEREGEGIQSGICEIGDSKETERGVQRRATELQLLHPQFSFNWLSPQAKKHKKWKTMQDVAEWQSGKQSKLQLGAWQIWF